jgi:hypothetical protein
MGWKLSDITDANLRKRIVAATLVASPQVAEPQPPIRHEPLAAGSVQKRSQKKIKLRFTQFTRRRQDPDNVVTKVHTDWLRSEGIIPDDTDDDVSLVIRQIQVSSKEEEGVLIEVQK